MTKREDLHLAIGTESPVVEARGLHRSLSAGRDVEDLRTLIAIPPKLECVLRADAQAKPRDACWVFPALPALGRTSALAFERLASSSAPIATLPEDEEAELAPTDEDKARRQQFSQALASCYRPNIDVVISPVGEGDSR